MKVIHPEDAFTPGGPSIFLAGPTPRKKKEAASWRPAALEILARLGFAGAVLVPERRDGWVGVEYLDQVEWEHGGLEGCSAIAFWVPRDVETLPGFTTNVEFGRHVGSGRCVYGRPEGAAHTRYLDWLFAKVTGRRHETTLEATMREAMRLAG